MPPPPAARPVSNGPGRRPPRRRLAALSVVEAPVRVCGGERHLRCPPQPEATIRGVRRAEVHGRSTVHKLLLVLVQLELLPPRDAAALLPCSRYPHPPPPTARSSRPSCAAWSDRSPSSRTAHLRESTGGDDALAVDAASGRECGVGVPSSGTNRRDESVAARASARCTRRPVGAGSVELRQTFYDAVGALRDELRACEELMPELADPETELVYLLDRWAATTCATSTCRARATAGCPRARPPTAARRAARRAARSVHPLPQPGGTRRTAATCCWPAGSASRIAARAPSRRTPRTPCATAARRAPPFGRRRPRCETRAERQHRRLVPRAERSADPDLDETSLRTLGSLDREATADACAEQFEVLCEQEMRANNHPSVNAETLGALAPVETKPGPARDKRPALVGPKGVNSV